MDTQMIGFVKGDSGFNSNMAIFGIYIKISGVYLLACSVLGSRCSKKSMNLWMGLFIEGPNTEHPRYAGECEKTFLLSEYSGCKLGVLVPESAFDQSK